MVVDMNRIEKRLVKCITRRGKLKILKCSKFYTFPPVLHSPQMETDGYIQVERRLSIGTEVIRRNARHKEVMQRSA